MDKFTEKILAPKKEDGIVEFQYTLPDREPYEGKATLKQKQKIWELKYRDQAVIDKLGKRQASFLIDVLLKAHKKERRVYDLCFNLIVLIIGFTVLYYAFRPIMK